MKCNKSNNSKLWLICNNCANLFSTGDTSLCKDDYPEVTLDFYDLSHTVRVARVVDVSSKATWQRSIHNTVLIQSEHVDTTVLWNKQQHTILSYSFKVKETSKDSKIYEHFNYFYKYSHFTVDDIGVSVRGVVLFFSDCPCLCLSTTYIHLQLKFLCHQAKRACLRKRNHRFYIQMS